MITVDWSSQDIGPDHFLGLDLVGQIPRKTYVRASQISMVTPIAEARNERDAARNERNAVRTEHCNEYL